MIRTIAPLHDWRRHEPTARAIAAELAAQPALLALRSRRLVADVRARFGVSPAVGYRAIGLARRAVRA